MINVEEEREMSIQYVVDLISASANKEPFLELAYLHFKIRPGGIKRITCYQQIRWTFILSGVGIKSCKPVYDQRCSVQWVVPQLDFETSAKTSSDQNQKSWMLHRKACSSSIIVGDLTRSNYLCLSNMSWRTQSRLPRLEGAWTCSVCSRVI